MKQDITFAECCYRGSVPNGLKINLDLETIVGELVSIQSIKQISSETRACMYVGSMA